MSERKPVLTRAMWVFASLCTGVMVLLFVLTHRLAVLKSGQTNQMSYYLAKDYASSGELFSALFNHPGRFFLWCCDCILYYVNLFGMSYAELNIHLFVILQPMLTLLFMGLLRMQTRRVRG
jgi:hypothetical protein